MTKPAERQGRAARLAEQMDALCGWRQVAMGEERTRLGGDVRAAFEALENGDLASGPHVMLAVRGLDALQTQVDALTAERAAGTACSVERRRQIRRELAELIEGALTRRRASRG